MRGQNSQNQVRLYHMALVSLLYSFDGFNTQNWIWSCDYWIGNAILFLDELIWLNFLSLTFLVNNKRETFSKSNKLLIISDIGK